MAILVSFSIPTMNVQNYTTGVNALEAAGSGSPAGRLYHVAALQEDGSFIINDVWESPESFDEFGKVLMPILIESGVQPVEPKIYPVHNTITG
jgi:hypothetical protein